MIMTKSELQCEKHWNKKYSCRNASEKWKIDTLCNTALAYLDRAEQAEAALERLVSAANTYLRTQDGDTFDGLAECVETVEREHKMGEGAIDAKTPADDD
jgi:hypothetical protein